MGKLRSGKERPKGKLARAKMGVGLTLLSGGVLLVSAVPGFAACSGQPQHVAGGILTDFIDQSHTDGIAIGDLRGSVGVEILSAIPNGFRVHHHWVIESGDQIFLADADLTVFPTSDPNGRALGDYLNGVNIIGGTGRFDKASGNLGAWGAVDLSQGKLTLRYEGTICFHPVSAG
jgi:hypothetical protein